MRLLLWCVLLASSVAVPAAAQVPTRTSLSLDEALEIARRNNPVYLQSITGRTRASAAVRSAWGALLPSVDASLGASYREGRPQFFGGVAFGATSDIISSSWGLSASSRLSLNTFSDIKRANASMDAAEADVEAAYFTLRNGVTAQFLLALQTEARADLADTLMVQQRLQLQLAQARAGVGAGTSLDVKRAEVAVGTQEVAALRARNTAEVARLELFQQLGVPMPEGVDLLADLPMTMPEFSMADLLENARRANPTLEALRARERVAVANVKSARGAYTPTLSLNASVGAFTQSQTDIEPSINQAAASAVNQREGCFTTDSMRVGAGMPSIAAQCNSIAFTPAQAQAMRDANDRFPFGFTRNPYNLSLSISLPLFDGLAREQRLQEANAGRTDAQYNVRRQELALTAQVTSALVTLQAARRTVELQERNAATAREALQLAEERYRVGANTFVDLSTARAEFEKAETDRIDMIYEFHRAFAALEAAVGRTLR
ncbi:MAG TPA: TolC family protein [Gemmatimonadaceae bacterium]|nr:TolC family protein [Gemmatimonadaceae bacterium]